MKYENVYVKKTCKKVVWNTDLTNSFLYDLNGKKHKFDGILDDLVTGETDINHCINTLTGVIQEISFDHFGKILSTCSNRKAYKAGWFDNSCRNAKTNFMNAKRNFDVNPTHENRAVFLNERCKYSKIKRRCKRNFYDNEKEKISEMSKKSPRKFWKYVKRYRKKDAGDTDVSLDEFYDYLRV